MVEQSRLTRHHPNHIGEAQLVAGGESAEDQHEVAVTVERACLHVQETHEVLNCKMALALQVDPLLSEILLLQLIAIKATQYFIVPVLSCSEILAYDSGNGFAGGVPCCIERVMFIQ